MRNFRYPHDIIENCCRPQARIIEILAPLFKQNLSVTEIAEQTGIKRTTVWETLKHYEKELRVHCVIPYERWRKGHKRTGARPPYGFCFLQGEVVRDPKEYPTLLLIHNLWTRGSEIMSIVASLSDKKIKSRTGKEWSYGVIKAIGKRFDSGAVAFQGSKLVLSEEFLKGVGRSKAKQYKKKKGEL
ncbi:MAG: helix-turn-helix domain-containing protein [Pseudobdellovibrionaceae bacterium]